MNQDQNSLLEDCRRVADASAKDLVALAVSRGCTDQTINRRTAVKAKKSFGISPDSSKKHRSVVKLSSRSLAALKEGLRQSGEGKCVYLGSFVKDGAS